MEKQTWRASGKLLLTGEYFVLDGATALAMPTRFGQNLWVEPLVSSVPKLVWQSLGPDATCWFSVSYNLLDFSFFETNDEKTATRLASIFLEIRRQRPDFLTDGSSIFAQTQTDFPRAWGLGTSSTLLALLAKWSGADPFLMLKNTFGGSGYDLACAVADGPIFYQLLDGEPKIEPTYFSKKLRNSLYFIYLGQKMDSREGIKRYRARAAGQPDLIEKISALSRAFAAADSLAELEAVIEAHEKLVAAALDLPRAHDLFFSDYFFGKTKSLGAWGGDFVLATSDRSAAETRAWFAERGFEVVRSFDEMFGE